MQAPPFVCSGPTFLAKKSDLRCTACAVDPTDASYAKERAMPGAITAAKCPGCATDDEHKSCEPCRAGTAPNDRRTECVPCTVNDDNVTTFSADGAKCLPCVPPKVTDIDHTTCAGCPAGTAYSPTGCVACTGNTYSAAVGAMSCKNCTAPSVVGAGHTTCTGCDPGTEFNAATKKCTPCIAKGMGNWYSPGDGVPCKICEDPLSVDSKNANCTLTHCPDFKAMNPEKTWCAFCPAGKEPASDQSACNECADPLFSPDGRKCKKCTDAERVGSKDHTQCMMGTVEVNSPHGHACCGQPAIKMTCPMGTITKGTITGTCSNANCPVGGTTCETSACDTGNDEDWSGHMTCSVLGGAPSVLQL
jgi:hypothetical protein